MDDSRIEETRRIDTGRPENAGPAADRSRIEAASGSKAKDKQAVLCDRYVLEEPIGVGGTSVVFRARDLQRETDGAGGSRVAVKLLREELRSKPFAIERLKREFRLAQALTHPHVVRVYDLNCDDGHWFMTMELLEGRTLSAALTTSPFAKGEPAFTPRRAADLLRACGEALAFGHDHGVVHGDFKPGNVFIPVSGQIRVLDFGAATSVEPSLEPHAPAATACYASPEVLGGARPDRRDDVFSFGCVAYELLTGSHPFDRRSAADARASGWKPARSWNLGDRQWDALESALSFTRETRPDNIRRLLGELFPAASADRVEVQDRIEVPDRVEVADYGAPFGAARSKDYRSNDIRHSFEPAVDAAVDGSTFQAHAFGNQFARGRADAHERLPAIAVAPIHLPPDQFGPKVRAPFIGIAMLITLALAAAAVYFQLNGNPQLPDELRTNVTSFLDNLKGTFAASEPSKIAQPAGQPEALAPVDNAPGATVNIDTHSVQKRETRSARGARAGEAKGAARMPAASPQTNEAAVDDNAMTPDERVADKPAAAAPLRATANDTAVGTFVSFAQDSITVDEGANSAVLELSRHENLVGRTEVRWRAVSGTAREGEDFIANASGVAIFADGQTTRSIYVPLMRDAIAEPQEEFFVELYDPAPGAQIWPTARARIVIRDDD